MRTLKITLPLLLSLVLVEVPLTAQTGGQGATQNGATVGRSGGLRTTTPRVPRLRWRGRETLPLKASLESYRDLDEITIRTSRPWFVYITTGAEAEARRVETYEDAVLTHEKLLIALKFFETFRIYDDELGDDALSEVLGKIKPLTFYVLHRGRVIGKSGVRPSAPELMKLVRSAFGKIYTDSFDKLLAAERKLLDDKDRILREADRLNTRREGMSRKEELALLERIEKLSVRYEAVELKERELFRSVTLRKTASPRMKDSPSKKDLPPKKDSPPGKAPLPI